MSILSLFYLYFMSILSLFYVCFILVQITTEIRQKCMDKESRFVVVFSVQNWTIRPATSLYKERFCFPYSVVCILPIFTILKRGITFRICVVYFFILGKGNSVQIIRFPMIV